MITYEDFSKLELRTAKILSAARVDGSEKLLKLQVSIGSEERQIIAGIGKNHQPEDLVGRVIVIIANLEPRKLMGLESQGMLLAADSEAGPVILTTESESEPGMKIK
jgi:methionyl-tRNA synthetase